jgi:hypothetical protein
MVKCLLAEAGGNWADSVAARVKGGSWIDPTPHSPNCKSVH